MKSISVIPNTRKDFDLKETHKLVSLLNEFGKEVIVDKNLDFKHKELVREVESDKLSQADLIVVLGGDGTILNIAESAAENNTPILGINLGNLGFLSQSEEISKEMFDDVFSGKYSIRECMMLRATVYENEEKKEEFTALNDVVLKGEMSRMVNIKLDVDGTNTNNYPADGVIIATATGSTAYSLSAGGAIVHPELDAIMITPICPHTLKARCMIVPDNKVVEVSFREPYRNNPVLSVDGKRTYILDENDYVRVVKSNHKVKFINLNKRSFFDIVREKIADRIM